MITIFNRMKLAIVFSRKDLVRLRSLLAMAHIEYKVCIEQDLFGKDNWFYKADALWYELLGKKDDTGPRITYIFYVRKKDFGSAAVLARRRPRNRRRGQI